MLQASYKSALNIFGSEIMYMYFVMHLVQYYKYRMIPKGLNSEDVSLVRDGQEGHTKDQRRKLF